MMPNFPFSSQEAKELTKAGLLELLARMALCGETPGRRFVLYEAINRLGRPDEEEDAQDQTSPPTAK